MRKSIEQKMAIRYELLENKVAKLMKQKERLIKLIQTEISALKGEGLEWGYGLEEQLEEVLE